MTYSTTGFAYLILSLVLGYVIYRIFRYVKKDLVAKLWICMFTFFGLFAFSRAISGVFFADNPLFLKASIYTTLFFQTLSFATAAYFIVYVTFHSRISPWFGAIPVLIFGLILTILTIILSPVNPYLQANRAINWGLLPQPFLLIPRFFLFFIIFSLLIIILIKEFRATEDIFVKRKTLAILSLFIFAIIISLIDFIIIPFFGLDVIWRDIALIFTSILFLIIFTSIYRLPPAYKNERI